MKRTVKEKIEDLVYELRLRSDRERGLRLMLIGIILMILGSFLRLIKNWY